MATLDYDAFPHIFTTVVEYCDRKTLNGLRLLSAATKRDVDRRDCRHLRSICPRNSNEKPIWALDRNSGSPFLAKCNEELRTNRVVTKDQAFAVKNARSLTIWVGHLDEMCLETNTGQKGETGTDAKTRHLLQYMRPDCRLSLIHMFFDPDRDPPSVSPLSRTISLPAIYELTIEYTDYFPECACSPETRLEHTSPRLKLVEIEHRDRFCPLAVTAFTPTVEKLTLVVTNYRCVSAYIEDIKHMRLHPNLSVTVRYYDTTAIIDKDSLHRKLERVQALQAVWSEALGVPVEVEARRAPSTGMWG